MTAVLQYTALGMRPTVFDDVVHVKFGAGTSSMMGNDTVFDGFFFAYGVFVCWGVGEEEVAAVRRELKEFEVPAQQAPPC